MGSTPPAENEVKPLNGRPRPKRAISNADLPELYKTKGFVGDLKSGRWMLVPCTCSTYSSRFSYYPYHRLAGEEECGLTASIIVQAYDGPHCPVFRLCIRPAIWSCRPVNTEPVRSSLDANGEIGKW